MTHTEIDLNTYLPDSHAEVQMMLLHKDYFLSPEGHITLDDRQAVLIKKISLLADVLPTEFHLCIGCPCHENSYPNCSSCPHVAGCTSGEKAYPLACKKEDCQRFFDWAGTHQVGDPL